MVAHDWITVFAIGASAGAAGQLIRAISGLAALRRQQLSGELSEQFQGSTLLVSVLVGAVAGFDAALTMSDKIVPEASTETILGLVAAGYAGADFIEGFAGKHLPGVAQQKSAAGGAVVTQPAQSTAPAQPLAPAAPAVNVNMSPPPSTGVPPATPQVTAAVG